MFLILIILSLGVTPMELKEVRALSLADPNSTLSKWRHRNGCNRPKPKSTRWAFYPFWFYCFSYVSVEILGRLLESWESTLRRCWSGTRSCRNWMTELVFDRIWKSLKQQQSCWTFPYIIVLKRFADALQHGASQFEQQAGKLKRKYWWKNLKVSSTSFYSS